MFFDTRRFDRCWPGWRLCCCRSRWDRLLIERFRAAHIGQTIREEVPETHQKKAGTPTMGGLLILASCLIGDADAGRSARSVYLDRDIRDRQLSARSVSPTIFLKLGRGKGNGLSESQKLAWQFGCAFVAAVWLFGILRFGTHVTVPFLKHLHPNLHWWGYVPFAMVVIVACSNAVNLTDGLDGLAIGPVMTVGFCYWIFTYVAGNLKFARYLDVPHVPGAGEVAIFCAALIASSMGFLWYNAYPASMMMGDVGALSLGGALGTVALLSKQEMVLPVAGGIFVLEAVSVIMQRYYYKMTHRRIFLMAPTASSFRTRWMARDGGRHALLDHLDRLRIGRAEHAQVTVKDGS